MSRHLVVSCSAAYPAHVKLVVPSCLTTATLIHDETITSEYAECRLHIVMNNQVCLWGKLIAKRYEHLMSIFSRH